MSTKPNHRRGHVRVQDHGPGYESRTPAAGSNSTHVARSRAKWKRRNNRVERRTGVAHGQVTLTTRRRPVARELLEEHEDDQLLEEERGTPSRWSSLWPVAGRVTRRSFTTPHGICGELPAMDLLRGRKARFVR